LGKNLAIYVGDKTVTVIRETNHGYLNTVYMPKALITLSVNCSSAIRGYKCGDEAVIVYGPQGIQGSSWFIESWFIEVTTHNDKVYICYVKAEEDSEWRD
jgi:hypothetical protein